MEKRITLELRGTERGEVTSLDLSGCKTGGEWEGLTDEFVKLEELDLKDSSLTHIKLFPKLPSLTKLDLSDNRLSKGLEVLKDCPNLKILSLNDNKFKEVDSLKPLQALTKLTHLDIQGNEFEDEDHRQQLFALLPAVKYLDGKDVDGNDDEDSDDELEVDEEEEGSSSGDEESSGDDDEPGLSALYNNTELLDEEDGDYDEAGGEGEQEGDDSLDEEEDDDGDDEAESSNRGEKRKLEETGDEAAKK